jgi:hypothetical protein
MRRELPDLRYLVELVKLDRFYFQKAQLTLHHRVSADNRRKSEFP